MKTALIQSPLIWEDAKSNRSYFEEKINALPEDVDLIALPEMFSTGFTMNPYMVAETMGGETVLWLQSLAMVVKSAITGSLVIKENGNYYNRLLFIFPSGVIHYYDKRHLFSLTGEDAVYTKGTHRLIVEYKGFRICPMICYDLRFPVYSRNTVDYDLLIYVANWPEARIIAWDTLLKARAIENMAYVIGVNRIGEDDNKHQYIGHSQVVDCLGNYLVEPNENEGTFIATLDKKALLATRKKLGFLNDRDSFTISD